MEDHIIMESSNGTGASLLKNTGLISVDSAADPAESDKDNDSGGTPEPDVSFAFDQDESMDGDLLSQTSEGSRLSATKQTTEALTLHDDTRDDFEGLNSSMISVEPDTAEPEAPDFDLTPVRVTRNYPDILFRDDSGEDEVDSAVRLAASVKVLQELDQQEPVPVSLPSAETPEYAAVLSRLDPGHMSVREIAMFPDIVDEGMNAIEPYLKLRNRIVQMWHLNATKELTAASVAAIPEFQQQVALAGQIYQLLNRICAVNYGAYLRQTFPKLPQKIMVIGAGVAGLTAARKLQEFGFQVTVLEGRDRIGGRVHTWKIGNDRLAELGAMILTGLEGNPLYTVLHQQLSIELVKIGGRCPLFNSKGAPVLKIMDEVLEVEFNSLLSAASAYGRSSRVVQADSKRPPLSLGEALTILMKKEEYKCVRQAREHKENQLEMMKLLTMYYNEGRELQEKLDKFAQEFQKAKTDLNARDTHDTQWVYRLTRARMLSAADRLTDVKKRIIQVEEKLELYMKDQPPSEYLDAEGRGVLAWHEANLEFANANHLDCLSLQHWDQDDEYELPGGHFSVPTGMFKLPEALAQGLHVRLGHIVTDIVCAPEGVRIDVTTTSGIQTSFEVSAVCCTVPLGVLKQSVAKQMGSLSSGHPITFSPPLPLSKVKAISSMGYGVLNKVILSYKERFWQVKRALFGYVNEDIQRRGEFFLFWSLYDHPTLIVLIAGEAAVALQDTYSDEEIVNACQNTLRKIFGSDIEEPTETAVTRWGADGFSGGSYSSVAPGASGNTYDQLAAPLYDEDRQRLFFAGEHTIRNYPATVHGALLSGLREATRIADTFSKLVL